MMKLNQSKCIKSNSSWLNHGQIWLSFAGPHRELTATLCKNSFNFFREKTTAILQASLNFINVKKFKMSVLLRSIYYSLPFGGNHILFIYQWSRCAAHHAHMDGTPHHLTEEQKTQLKKYREKLFCHIKEYQNCFFSPLFVQYRIFMAINLMVFARHDHIFFLFFTSKHSHKQWNPKPYVLKVSISTYVNLSDVGKSLSCWRGEFKWLQHWHHSYSPFMQFVER